jgi:hypothetical protein
MYGLVVRAVEQEARYLYGQGRATPHRMEESRAYSSASARKASGRRAEREVCLPGAVWPSTTR